MKTFLVLIHCFALIAFCAPKGIPETVTRAFAERFPGAANVGWEKESAKEFEASFTLNAVAMSANFAPDGAWLETETSVAPAALPDAVKDSFAKQFPKQTMLGGAKVETPSGVTYEVEYRIGKKKHEALFDAAGMLKK